MHDEQWFYEHTEDSQVDDAWAAYRETLEQHKNPKGSRVDLGAFLPDPEELRKRRAQVRWMSYLGFGENFQISVMIYDCPTIEVVRKFVSRYGAKEAKRRLTPMLELTKEENQ